VLLADCRPVDILCRIVRAKVVDKPPRRFLVYRRTAKQFFDLSDRNAHFPRQYRRRKFVLLHKGLQQFCFYFHLPRSRFLVGSFLPLPISTKTGVWQPFFRKIFLSFYKRWQVALTAPDEICPLAARFPAGFCPRKTPLAQAAFACPTTRT